MRVLVLDAGTAIRVDLRAALRHAGQVDVVGWVSSRADAVRSAGRHRPDILFIVTDTPGPDVVETVRAIKRNARATGVFVMTRDRHPAKAVPVIEAGAEGYVFDDIAPADLSRGLRRVAAGEAMLNPKVAHHIIGLLARRGPDRLAGAELGRLTHYDIQVLAGLAHGKTNREIAASLHRSEATVKTHVRAIYRKLKVHNRAGAVALAVSRGLVLIPRRPAKTPPGTRADGAVAGVASGDRSEWGSPVRMKEGLQALWKGV